MDIELGYYFDKFKINHPIALKREVVFQFLSEIWQK